MERISEFQILSLKLSGFKSFAEPTELTFGNPTAITGGNGRGKSSVADAIAYVVTGLPFLGERGNDRLISEQNADMTISMRFVDGTGGRHELTRRWNKTETTLAYDGNKIRQSDLTEMFGEKDVFLSIFNPLYFIEELGDDGKNLLERYLPAIPKEEIMAQLPTTVRVNLEGEEFLSPEAYLKKLRADVKEKETDLIYLQGQRDLAETQTRDNAAKEGELENRISGLRDEHQSLEQKRFDGMDVSEMQSRMADLSAQYSELAGDRDNDADARILELTQKLGEKRAAVYEPKYTAHIAEAAEKVRSLSLRYREQQNVFAGIARDRTCPTCRRAVTDADLPVLKEAYQKAVGKIVTAGKEAQNNLNELEDLERKARETFEQFKAEDIAMMEAAIARVSAEKTSGDGTAERLNELHIAIQELTTTLEYGNLTTEEYDRLRECAEEIRETDAELSALRKLAPASPASYDGKISEAKKKIEGFKAKMEDVGLFIGKKTEMLAAMLHMNRVQISLYDVMKTTGEVKDAFKFTYNGRRYDRLSLSEKVRAGMELSELMKRLTGRNYPVFVDNMESIDDLNNVRPTGQVLMAKCMKDTELRVTPIRPILAEMETAA